MQLILINLRIHNTTLYFAIAYNAYAKVQFCMHIIRQTFALHSVENRCIQIPHIFSGSDVTARLSSAGSPDERSLHLQTGMGINRFLFNEIVISVFLRCTACAKMEVYSCK